MSDNKFVSNTKTSVGTKVSTQTKVLLGLMIVASIAGMFAIVGGLRPKTSQIPQKINNSNEAQVDQNGIMASTLGATKDEQYSKIAEMAGVSENSIRECFESEDGQGCSQDLRDIVEVGKRCLCTAHCLWEVNACSGTCSGSTCSKVCNHGTPYTVSGVCEMHKYIKIFGITIYL